MNISLIEYPIEKDWIECKRRCLVTVGKNKIINVPDMEWKKKILVARHSPIRYLRFSFLLEDIPYYVSVHLVRHIHAQPYVQTQRNDKQTKFERTKAPQDNPVNMILDCNAEEWMTICNKRLCKLADTATRELVQMMALIVERECPEFEGLLVPMCKYHGGVCHEMFPCGGIKS